MFTLVHACNKYIDTQRRFSIYTYTALIEFTRDWSKLAKLCKTTSICDTSYTTKFFN